MNGPVGSPAFAGGQGTTLAPLDLLSFAKGFRHHSLPRQQNRPPEFGEGFPPPSAPPAVGFASRRAKSSAFLPRWPPTRRPSGTCRRCWRPSRAVEILRAAGSAKGSRREENRTSRPRGEQPFALLAMILSPTCPVAFTQQRIKPALSMLRYKEPNRIDRLAYFACIRATAQCDPLIKGP